jgi:hypothetical protein
MGGGAREETSEGDREGGGRKKTSEGTERGGGGGEEEERPLTRAQPELSHGCFRYKLEYLAKGIRKAWPTALHSATASGVSSTGPSVGREV